MDWIDLRTHLIRVHGQKADEIDHLDGKAETGERRDRAETIHGTLHSKAPAKARSSLTRANN
jgi:hypothetical protein